MSFGIGGKTESTQSSLDEFVKSILQSVTTQSESTKSGGTGTSTTQQTGVSTGTQAGETERVLTPEQQQSQGILGSVISKLATNPAEFYAPAGVAAREQVNENFGGVQDSLRQDFLTGGGGGGSGKFGRALLGADLERRRQLSKADTAIELEKAKAPITAAGLAQNFLGLNFGTKSNVASSEQQTGGSTTSSQTDEYTNSQGTSETQATTEQERQQRQRGKSKSLGFNLGV